MGDESAAHAGPILAISTRGTIAKANLQARRALGGKEPLEGQQFGHLLSRVLSGASRSQEPAHLQVADGEGGRHDLLLVLGEQTETQEEHVAAESASEPDRQQANIADFIAHELRNNIAITLGLAQLLETNVESISQEDRASALQGIQTEAEHALLVLDGLLKLVESRRVTMPQAMIPLHSVIPQVVAEHRRRYHNRAFIVTGDSPVFAAGNSTWIRLAIANLIANAEKVTPREHAIEVNVCQEADRSLIIVLDHGVSLGPAVYAALWDIYAKGPPDGVEISGSGIGLSLCKELVEAMGGRVWAGPRLDGGSAFAISLQRLPETADLSSG